MRLFVGWVVLSLVSAGLGLTLYPASLQGATTGYQEAAYTPGPSSTVVKTKVKTKVVRKPPKTRVVYVPQAPVPGPTVYVPQGGTQAQSTDDSDDHHDDDDD
jgi:hypothetical protein